MKRCPQCYQPYADSERFCESDGQPLLTDIGVTSPIGKVADTEAALQDPAAQKREARTMVVVGIMVGMVITSLGYAGYSLFLNNPAAEEEGLPVSRIETVDNRQPTRPTRTAAVIEPSPVPEEETSPTPEAEAEAEESPAAESETVTARLNQGPVSTGEREQKRDERSDKTIIEMDDGTRLEVDAAWQDKQGVWYRRGGLVSFVESKRIKGIHAGQGPKSDSAKDPKP